MNENDKAMATALPQYAQSIFFSLGWARASEWSELNSAEVEMRFDTEYLLSTFPCILLKDDHIQHRFKFLEYFINDPREREEYLQLVKPFREKNSSPSYSDHPLMKKWSQEAQDATPEEYKSFIQNELAIFGSSNIKRYLQGRTPYFEELLVQGEVPIDKALNYQDFQK